MKASPWLATPAIVLLLCLSSLAKADVKITVTYTDVESEVLPNVVVHRTERKRELILTSDHKLISKFDYGYAGHTSNGTLTLGAAYQGKDFTGDQYNAKWYIERGAIVRVGHSRSSTSYVKITTNGTDSCSATIAYKLNKGYKMFEEKRMSNGEDMKLDDYHVENISCTIAAVSH